ncbi:tetratricopeptide repeat-containing hybrid sensor histidine kinase/response regulator [Aequorivita lipolytica]|uniref:histidine kinase n=1 Tax=Aequorivita lipolytica TaxID=153267 RepID=A0A5C6YMY7_9FLAO|nr:response regulator [Aequorivita lipolytica]TXD68645.1 response regulator [Aequorivita lipolytica]SRX53215.1 Sensory/regulatory protein RpfC [Aequorivita lipolytica]
MRQPTSEYKIFLPLILCLLISVKSFSTQIQDTIVAIKQLQYSAAKALETENFMEAVKNLNDASKLAMLPKYRSYKPNIELGIAELFYLEYFDKALEETEKAIESGETYKNFYKLGKAYYLYGVILVSKGKSEKAEIYLNKADSVFTELKDENSKAYVLYGKGLLALRVGNYEKSISYLKPAAESFKNQGLLYQEVSAYSYLADALSLIDPTIYKSPLAEARVLMQIVSEISYSQGFSKYLVENHRINSQVLIAERMGSEAEEELKYYLTQKDSLRQIHLKAIERGIQAESAIGDLNEIIATQQDDLSKQEKSLFFGKLTGWLSIALILILSLLTLSLYKNNNLRAKANELLQDKNTELQEAKEDAEKASQAKAQFLSTITHELRTPMYTVTGLTHLLLEEDPKPEQKEHLNSLKFSGEYLLSLINNILDLNKLEANKVEIEKAPFNLKKRVDGVLIALKKSAEAKNNNVHYEYDPTLPNEVIGDSLKISQILINLISNSIKFTENGDIWVRIKSAERTTKKVVIHFEVEDTGDGISKKKQNTIFESFSQGSLQINRKYGGTGLGLSIVKNLLELMGSKIFLESKLGEGSKFWFNIGYDIAESRNKATELKNMEVVFEDDIFENKTVMIVEDNKINQMITKKILEKKKMTCTVVDNGMDAIKHARKENFDVILMDIHMPGISGIEATKKIREFNKTVPIIALTAITIEENLEDFYKAGFNEFIPKPFNAEDFFEKINRVLRSNDFLLK